MTPNYTIRAFAPRDVDFLSQRKDSSSLIQLLLNQEPINIYQWSTVIMVFNSRTLASCTGGWPEHDLAALALQLGEEPASVTAAEKARRRAIEEGDDEKVLQANSDLIAAMLDCQYSNVALSKETSEVTIQVVSNSHSTPCFSFSESI